MDRAPETPEWLTLTREHARILRELRETSDGHASHARWLERLVAALILTLCVVAAGIMWWIIRATCER